MAFSESPFSAGGKEIVFVDSSVADWQTLVNGIRPGIEVAVLDGGHDGLAQMAEWAKTHSGYDAIHVLSHGSLGALQLGAKTLDHASLSDVGVQAELAVLGASLKADGDLLIYGCDVASGEAGQAFVANLAAATGADVAASDGPTGAAGKGGDWLLEKSIGAISAQVIHDDRYQGTLGTNSTFHFAAPTLGTKSASDIDNGETLSIVTVNDDPLRSIADAGLSASDTPNGTEALSLGPFGYESSATFSVNGGKLFDLSSLLLVDVDVNSETLVFTSSKGSISITPTPFDTSTHPYTFNVAGHANAAYFQGITSFAITTSTNTPANGGYVYTVAIDEIALTNITVPGPTVSSVTSSTTNGSYKAGDVISIQVTFSEAVTVDTSGGTPYLTLETGATDRNASYSSGSGSSTLTFTYTVQAGDISADLDYVATTSLALNSGTINATVGGAAAILTLASPGAANSLGANKAIVIDTAAPGAPSAPDMTLGTDSATNTDNITSDTTPDFTGTAEAGSTVTLYDTDGTTSLGSATATGGNWSITASTLSAGAHTLTAKATDTAGNVSPASGSLSVTIDATAPSAPSTPDMTAGTDSGMSDTDNTTSDTTPTFTGTAEANSTVTLISSVNGTVGTASADGSGNWSITASALNTGAHTVTATATDAAGNVSSASSGLSVNIDTTAPAITFSALSFSADTGSSSTDFNTKTAAQTITATLSGAPAGSDIVYGSLDNGGTWTDITAKVSGTTLTWDGVTLVASSTLKLKVTDSAGNDGTVASQAYTLDTGTPVVSAVSIPNASMKVGDTVTATITVADDGGVTYTLGGSSIGGFALSNLARTNSTTYTAQFTVTEGGADVAAGSSIPVSVVLSDTAGNSNSAFTTAISQAGDAINAHTPTDIALSNNSVATIGGVNAVVGALSSTDATSGDTFTYSLVAGAGDTNNGLFNINGGNLRANDAGALTAGNSYGVRVRTTDAAGNAYEEAFTVNAVVGPAIASATYDASSGVLTVTGSLLEANGGGADIAVNKLTLTGEGGATYTLTSADVEITSATEFSVTLNATDRAAVEPLFNQNGTASTGGTNFNLAAADDWNTNVTSGDTSDASSAVTVSNVPVPSITSATYDYNSNTLVVTGSGFLKKSGATNDIDISKLTFTGEGGAAYTLTSASDIEIDNATQFTITLSGADLTQVEALLSANGTSAASGAAYNLAAAEDWAAGAAAAVNVADLTGNGITVSNWAAPTLTSAAYDWSTGQLVLTGTNFVNASGANNDITANLLSVTGEGGSYTLADTSNVEITSATSATVTLSATDKLNVHGLLNKNGITSSGGTTYNLAAADGWMAGAPSASDIADATGNGITVSNAATPTITSATYDSDTGILSVTGTNLFKKSGAGNDVVIDKLTLTGGTGNATYTLTSATNVEIASATSFTVTLSGADKTSVDALLDQIGTTSSGGSIYNLAAADDWLAAADSASDISDTSNAVTVSIAPRLTNATYDANTGVLVVTGTNMQANGGGADIDVSKLTLTGEGGSTYNLTTANVERDSASQFTVTLNATDKAAVNQILNKTGASSTGATSFNLAAADDWCTNVTAADTSDATNAITVSNPDTPTLTSATYDASTGTLVVTGSGFLKLGGVTNDIDVSKLTITGEGGATYTLTTSSVEITSGTAFSVTLNATDLAAVNQMLNKAGISSTGGTTYNLAAAEDWAAGAAAAVTVADLAGNGVTVSNPTTPAITSATYNSTTGVLVVTGSGFLKLSGATNDVAANKFTITGEGGATYTLTDSANVEITSATAFSLTLSSTDKAGVNALVNKAGTSSNGGTTYNLAAAEDWAAGAWAAVNVADLAGNGITATLNQVPVITSNGGGATAALNVAESSTAVATVTATDADGDTPAFSLTGGTDQAKFSINAATGALTFTGAPDFENPTDSDTNNTYVVEVTADDGHGGTDAQAITVTVTDVGEGGGGGGGTATPPVTPPTSVDGTTVTTEEATSGGQTTTTQTVTPVAETRQDDPATTHSSLADIPLVTSGSGETLLQVGLPVGVGLTSQTISGSAVSTLRDLLIAASDPKVADVAVFEQILSHGIDSYVPTVQDQQQVSVRTITFSQTSTVPDLPIIVTGALGTGEDNAQNPLRQEALVLDTRNLPSGTVLELDNVEFAVVVGAARLTGGNGRNFVIGDDASQYIVLGADDDELHGGGGDDFVGSRGGNDKLFGDEGNDTVSGGDGNDIVDGGAGKDMELGGTGSDTAAYSGSSSRYQVSYEYGKTVVSSLDDPGDIDTLVNVETLKFSDKSVTVTHTQSLEWLATLYQKSLGRQADLGGFQYWAQSVAEGVSEGVVALGFLRSAESQQKTGAQFDQLDSGAQIEYLYTQLLGRASEASGKEAWMQQHSNGMSIGEIARSFVHSVELTGQYLVPEGWDFFV